MNVGILKAVWKDIFDHGLPFCIGGDFNMGPSEMASNAPLVQIAGVVRAPLAFTFVVPEAYSVIDYFIVSRHLDFAAGQ
eukprot:2227647-Pyramimonas_sp.AAC.1